MGQGVTASQPDAFEWSLRAAKHGSAFAECNLGTIYKAGLGMLELPRCGTDGRLTRIMWKPNIDWDECLPTDPIRTWQKLLPGFVGPPIREIRGRSSRWD
jgi:TPR repeat protein